MNSGSVHECGLLGYLVRTYVHGPFDGLQCKRLRLGISCAQKICGPGPKTPHGDMNTFRKR